MKTEYCNSSTSLYDEIIKLEAKKHRLETDPDYANMKAVGAAIEELNQEIIQLKIQAIEQELGKKIATVHKPNKTL